MMGRRDRDQGQLFYEFKLDNVVPKNHLLRRMNVLVTPDVRPLMGIGYAFRQFAQQDAEPWRGRLFGLRAACLHGGRWSSRGTRRPWPTSRRKRSTSVDR
jgi:hypothetical protein